MTHPLRLSTSPSETQQSRFARRVTVRLNTAAEQLPHDITERLRIARQRALSQIQPAHTLVLQTAGTAALGGGEHNPWARWVSVIPLLVLLASLVTLNWFISDERTSELAEIDSALLTDDLPPAAYTDPGFAQFLKNNRD